MDEQSWPLLCEQASGFGNSFLDWSTPADTCELTPTSSLIIYDWIRSSNFCSCQRVWRLSSLNAQVRRQPTLSIPGILMIYKQVLADPSRPAAVNGLVNMLHCGWALKACCCNAGLCAMAKLLASAYWLVIILKSCLLHIYMSRGFQLIHWQDKGAWEVLLCSTVHDEYELCLGWIIQQPLVCCLETCRHDMPGCIALLYQI